MRAITVSSEVGRRVRARRRRRQLHALDALGDDRLDDRGDHRGRRRPAVAAADRGDRARHRRGERVDRRAVERAPAPSHGGVDQSGPAGVRRRAGSARSSRSPPGARLRGRRGRATARWRRRRRGRGRRRRRRASRAHPSAGWRPRRRAGRRAAARPDAAASPPAARRSLPAGSASSSLPSGGRAAAGRPHHDLPGGPRRLQLDLAGLARLRRRRRMSSSGRLRCARRSAAAGRSRAAVARRLSSVSVKSATTWSRSSPVRLRTEARSSSASTIRRSSTAERRPLVGVEERQVVVRAPAVGDRPDRRFELLCVEHPCPSWIFTVLSGATAVVAGGDPRRAARRAEVGADLGDHEAWPRSLRPARRYRLTWALATCLREPGRVRSAVLVGGASLPVFNPELCLLQVNLRFR